MASRVPERHRPRARHSAPQFVIVMKACPGLRSGIDRSSSLSLVIPAPQFVIPAKAGIQRGGGEGIVAVGLVPSHRQAVHRAPLRHSRENGNPRTNASRKNGNREITKNIHRENCSAGTSSPGVVSRQLDSRSRYRDVEASEIARTSHLAGRSNLDSAIR